ncbi:MAG: hypothetical protein ABIF82_02615 [Planctomycetota bacterium]
MKARKNPLRTECVHQVRYRFLDGTWDGLMARLLELNYRAAVVGPDGSGKTTLLEELAPRLERLGFRVHRFFLNDEQRRIPEAWFEPAPPARRAGLQATSPNAHLDENDIILLDGADLMSRLAWLRFRRRARQAAGLVITSHRPGMLPTLIDCSTTPELLDGIIVDLLGTDYDGRRERLPFLLFKKHKGNVRNALRELYDIHAGIA